MNFLEYSTSGTGTTTLTGSVNGTNSLFQLPVAPVQLQVFRNGLFQLDARVNPASDFSWVGKVITFGSGSTPQTGDIITALVFTP